MLIIEISSSFLYVWNCVVRVYVPSKRPFSDLKLGRCIVIRKRLNTLRMGYFKSESFLFMVISDLTKSI